jgi:hypothetical protein
LSWSSSDRKGKIIIVFKRKSFKGNAFLAPFIKSFLINAKRASFYQDRLGTNIGKTLIEKTCLCRATTLTAGQMRALSKAVRAEGYGNVFSAPFYGLLKTILLPRQARDKRRKS